MDLQLPQYLIMYIKPLADAKGISQQAYIKALLRKQYEESLKNKN